MNSLLANWNSKFENLFDGNNWYGDNINLILNNVSSIKAFNEFSNNHSIAEILLHLTNWHKFVEEKLKGNEDFEIFDKPLDWQKVADKTEQNWMVLKENFYISKLSISHQIESMEDSILIKQVSGRDYNFEFLLDGIIQHDVYHFGQISILSKQLIDTDI